jgi:DNA-binding PadR family transcriptional regulator
VCILRLTIYNARINTTLREEVLLLTPQVQQILVALSARRLNGYGVMWQAEQDSDGMMKLGPGTVYPALRKLAAMGYVKKIEVTALGRTPHRYELTDIGRMVLGWEIRRQRKLAELAEESG